MLHLAQVKKKNLGGKVKLKLLARQRSEHAWTVLHEDDSYLWAETEDYNEGALVLVDLSSKRQIQTIQDATPWILEIMEAYLTVGITPAILQEEVQRAEQWRQSLTLKSQELGRRALEMEARRDQIQELEENLKREKENLEAMAAQLKVNIADIVQADADETNAPQSTADDIEPADR
jgi:hypothetical protein